MPLSSKKQKQLKRKHHKSFNESSENTLNGDILDESSQEPLLNGVDSDSETTPVRPFWALYKEVYEKLAKTSCEVQTTDDCIKRTRIVDLTSSKLVQEVQKLDLSSVDHWANISSLLVQNWNKFFCVPENDGWSFGNLIPLNRYKSICFGNHSLLLKRKNPENFQKSSQKKAKISRKDDNTKSKVSKPLEGMVNDKPLPLIEHMKRVRSAIEENCTNGHRSVEYFKLVINPNSFSATVYNIFTMSFLLREGLVSFHIGKEEELRVSLRPEPASQKNQLADQTKGHFIIDLTYDEWKALAKTLKIKSAMVSCPSKSTEDDIFFQRFSQSQKEIGRRKRT